MTNDLRPLVHRAHSDNNAEHRCRDYTETGQRISGFVEHARRTTTFFFLDRNVFIHQVRKFVSAGRAANHESKGI